MAHNGGGSKAGRKYGRGTDKVKRSRWGSYQNLIGNQKIRQAKAVTNRFCKLCSIQFPSKNVFNRHNKKVHAVKE